MQATAQADAISVHRTGYFLSSEKWKAEKTAYEQTVSRIVDPYLGEKSRQLRDPVMDFMFTYYSFSPSRLKQWSPGAGAVLEGAADDAYFQHPAYTTLGDDLLLDPLRFPEKKIRGLRWMLQLLKAISGRSPNLNCCGMHEWAMVYEAEEVRHESFPLRLPQNEIKSLVDSHPVNCTHFDAFRFFTPQAQPLNAHTLSRDNMHEFEQPGCLHANMDLYKWCFKLSPWIPGRLMLDCFMLACKARVLDMKAGPYDLSSIGYEPIPVETEDGRKIYKRQQAEIWQEAAPLRDSLAGFMQQLLQKRTETQTAAT